jgi:HypF finger/Acylphosphatase
MVGNDVDGVFAEVEGSPEAVREFLAALERDAPPLARVDRVAVSSLAPVGAASFGIVASEPGGRRRALIAADTATCADCLRELADPADRRFQYPFTNCTNCGPRFTIVSDVPYDRPLTTMAGFPMCGQCAREYNDPANRQLPRMVLPRQSTSRRPSGPWPGPREWARPTPTNCSHSRPAESMLPITEQPGDRKFKCGCRWRYLSPSRFILGKHSGLCIAGFPGLSVSCCA